MSEVYLVTGANSGLGMESVRQLAVRKETKKIFLACRSEQKALAAIETLVKDGCAKDKLQFVKFDASASKTSIGLINKQLGLPLNGLILNAGGIGHDTSKKPSGPNNVLDVHQINIIGHIQLVQALMESSLLAKGCRIVYSGSEAARGVLFMGILNPKMGNDSSWYRGQVTGESLKGFDVMDVYAKSKGFGALYFAAWARRNPDYHVLTISPGATLGTEVFSVGAMPAHFRILMPVMKPLMACFRVMHPVHFGAERYVRGVLGIGDMANFESGVFVASKSKVSGPVCDQAKLKAGKKYADHGKQEAAFEALSAYLSSATSDDDAVEA